MRRLLSNSALLLFAAVVVGCQSQRESAPAGKIRVVVSIPPQAWLVERIGGERVDVFTMVNPGESHETYQPTDAQMARVAACAVLFRVGIPFENGRAFQSMIAQANVRVVDTRKGIHLREMSLLEQGGNDAHAGDDHDDEGHDHDHEGHGHTHHHHSGKDPHIWLSLRLLKTQAQTIAAMLGELDPPRQAEYAANLAALEQSLDAADEEIRRILEPHHGKVFLVFHPAWGYFADDYGLRQAAIEVEGKEPSDKEATAIQSLARRETIRVVFVQPQIASRGAEAIAQAIGARLEKLDPLTPNVIDNLLRTARAIAASHQ